MKLIKHFGVIPNSKNRKGEMLKATSTQGEMALSVNPLRLPSARTMIISLARQM